MLAVITRPMVIATDAGTAKQFLVLKDEGGEDVPEVMSEAEFGRLRRAGAAQRFIEVNHAEAEAEPATGLLKTDLGSINGLGEADFSDGAGAGPVVQAEGEPDDNSSSMGSATVVAPVKPNGKRK